MRIIRSVRRIINIAITIIIITMTFILIKNMHSENKQNNENIEINTNCMQVFMDYEATDDDIIKLKEDLLNIEGIDKIEFVSKEEAYNTRLEKIKNNESLLEGFSSQSISPSYLVTIANESNFKEIKGIIEQLKLVRSVSAQDIK